MSDTIPYCGIKDVPKGRHRGNMIECIKKNQVNYFGLHKVDKKLLDKVNKMKSKSGEMTELDLRKKVIGLKSGIKTLARKFQESRDKEEKKKLKEQAEKKHEEFKKYNKMLKDLLKKKEKENKPKKKTTKENKSNTKKKAKKNTKKKTK